MFGDGTDRPLKAVVIVVAVVVVVPSSLSLKNEMFPLQCIIGTFITPMPEMQVFPDFPSLSITSS